jgi:hypothetical protein
MDASAFEPVVFTLADGTKISLLSGSPLPKGLPRDFKVVVIPHIFMEEVGQDVFVQTDLSELEEQIKGQEEHEPKQTHSEVQPRSEKYWEAWTTCTYRMTRGDARAQKTWTNFNDCVIVAACLVATGRNLELIEQPRIVRDESANLVYLSGQVFTLCNSVTPKGRIVQMLSSSNTYFETTQYVSP